MTLGVVILIVSISIISMRIGYNLGNHHLHETGELLQELKDRLRDIIFTRQNWTSKEIFDHMKLIIGDMAKYCHIHRFPDLKNTKKMEKPRIKIRYQIHEN